MRCGSPVSRFDATSWKFHSLSLSLLCILLPPTHQIIGSAVGIFFGFGLVRIFPGTRGLGRCIGSYTERLTRVSMALALAMIGQSGTL